jgi:indolepyruvate ferredoxin oxidoreductase beta subunit
MNHTIRNTFDVYLVGVGGQGVLTLGDLITEAAVREGIPANFYPTKGMAQRGGFVKVQLRLGRETVGPNIPEQGADVAIAMELSESLKAVRFVKPGGDFLLFGHTWLPTAVMADSKHPLGKVDYPTLEQVEEQMQKADVNLHYLDPEDLPLYEGAPVAANVYTLGAALGHTGLGEILDADDMVRIVANRWKKAAERNTFAFQAGVDARVQDLAFGV